MIIQSLNELKQVGYNKVYYRPFLQKIKALEMSIYEFQTFTDWGR